MKISHVKAAAPWVVIALSPLTIGCKERQTSSTQERLDEFLEANNGRLLILSQLEVKRVGKMLKEAGYLDATAAHGGLKAALERERKLDHPYEFVLGKEMKTMFVLVSVRITEQKDSSMNVSINFSGGDRVRAEGVMKDIKSEINDILD